MKTVFKVIFGYIFLFSCLAFADMPQHYTPWPPNGTFYLQGCPGECYPLVENGIMKDIEVLMLLESQVDDPEKPIYSQATNVQGCNTREECQVLIAPKCPEGNPDCSSDQRIPYCTLPDLPFFRAVDDAFEAYCTHLVGYQQKTIKQLVEDPVKVAAKQARLQADADAETQRKAALLLLKQRLKALGNQTDMTAAEVKEAIMKTLKTMILNKQFD